MSREEAELLRALVAEDADNCVRSYRYFLESAWSTVEPGVEFKPNWHIDAIANHLEAVAKRDVRRLIINVPPRHGKSLLTSVCWLPWIWTHEPSLKLLCASYAKELSVRDSVAGRRLIDSPWYQERFGDKFQMTSDQNVKSRYENDKRGYRISASVDSALTGDGGSIITIDDPHNAREANSDASRQAVLDWWDNAVSTRLNDPKTGAFVVIMQRLHDRDLTGHILAKEQGWDHLVLPARYERTPVFPVKSSIGFKDPRTAEGELICPSRFGDAEVRELERKLGTYGAAGQLQQRPAPQGGGMIKISNFKLWPAKEKLPKFDWVIQSYDTAFTDRTSNDPTACTVWGVFQIPNKNRLGALLIDAWSEHLSYPDLRKRLAADYFDSGYGPNDRKADELLIEEKGSGIALVRDLSQMRSGDERVNVRTYNPGKADKVARVNLCLPQLEDGLMWIPESTGSPNEPVSWALPFLSECARFPKGAHDDYIDSVSQCMIRLKDLKFVSVDLAANGDDDIDWTPKERLNPYAA